MTLLVTVLTTVTTASAADVIELTFAGRGEATTADQVTVTNLTHTDIAPVTLSGSATLRLVDVAAAMRKGDVNVDNQVGIGDIVAITNVMAGSSTDAGLKTRSDVNGDGEVGIGDIVAITNLMAGNFGGGSTAGAVTMQFNAGDILRFEGTSGQMRTLMHLSPESSHAVTFDFFKCEDAAGYNYPIVRIGDMLWMLEDLRPLKMDELIRTDKANIWKGVGDYEAAEFVVGDRAYYTVQGARMAMPEGWEMPSIDEIYAMVKELGNDSLKLGDFMKDRDADWPKSLVEGPDTIHMQLMPNGYVNRDGELTSDERTGAWPTRTTINHGCPATFEIGALNSVFHPLVIHDKRCAFSVRGCRPAPSVYQEMLQTLFDSEKQPEVAPIKKMPMQLVNTNGPLGSYYTYGSARNSIFLDFSACQWNSSTSEKRSGVLYKDKYEGKWLFDSKNLVPLDVNGAYCNNHLRKVAAQGNADGYENVVYASWSRPFKQHFNGDLVFGEGLVNITIFGDSTKNHSILENYATRPLLDADGNEYRWKMPYYFMGYTIADNGNRQLYWIEVGCEYYARAFNLKCIQDQTGDGVEEIVMNVANKIAIFDGVTLRCIRERVFVDEGSYIGTPNLRYDVADVNGDGYEDIVMVMNNNDIGSLRVYSKGYINEEPIVNKPLSSPTLFCDVKVGCMSNSDLPEIAILTRGLENNSNDLLTKNGYLYMYRLHYNNDLSLTEQIVLPKTSVDCFAANDETRNHVGNMDLVFGYFRGRNYTQDLIVGDGLWRWDETNAKPTFRFVALGSVKSASYSVAADAIAAVQASEADGKEILVFIWNMIVGRNDGCNHTLSEFWEVWLSDDGKTANIRNSFNQDYFGWCNNGSTWSKDMKNPEETKWMFQNMRDGNELNSHPVLCKFADRVRPKRFRYISHELTFSEPRIYAAIAAAPYYEGLSGADRAETVWGKTTSSSDKTVKSDTWGGSVIGGYEHSFSVPFLGISAGVEFTTKVTVSGGIATEHETTTSYGQTYAAGEDHVVVMHATPYDTYRYEIMSSDDPDDIGTEFVLSMPRTRAFVGLKLADYVQLMASQKGVARPQYHLTSTPGDPWSYPGNYDNAPMYVNDNYPFLKAKDLNGGFTNEMAGTGAYTSRSISLATSDARTTSVSVDVETELVATFNGVKAGVGFNYNHTNESTHTIGEEFTVEGSVPGLPSLNDMEHPQFRWNLVWYYVKDAGGVYPVVNYIVTRP